MDVAATETTGSGKPAATTLRAPYVGLAAGLLWAAAAFLAYRQLTPYPPRYAGLILAVGALWWGFTTWPVLAMAHSRAVNALMIAAAAALPFVLVTWIPDVAQPPEHAIPGAPTFALVPLRTGRSISTPCRMETPPTWWNSPMLAVSSFLSCHQTRRRSLTACRQ